MEILNEIKKKRKRCHTKPIFLKLRVFAEVRHFLFNMVESLQEIKASVTKYAVRLDSIGRNKDTVMENIIFYCIGNTEHIPRQDNRRILSVCELVGSLVPTILSKRNLYGMILPL